MCSNGTLAIDRWAVTFGTVRRGLGRAAACPVPSSLYQMDQPSHHHNGPSLYSFNVSIKGLKCASWIKYSQPDGENFIRSMFSSSIADMTVTGVARLTGGLKPDIYQQRHRNDNAHSLNTVTLLNYHKSLRHNHHQSLIITIIIVLYLMQTKHSQ